MPFRCKCGRTFEKVETFSSHSSGCALFHQRRVPNSEILSSINAFSKQETQVKEKVNLSVQIDKNVIKEKHDGQRRFSTFLSPIYDRKDSFFNSMYLTTPSPTEQNLPITPTSAPIYEGERFSFMMPTALSIQNTFEGVQRRKSTSYSNSNSPTAAYK